MHNLRKTKIITTKCIKTYDSAVFDFLKIQNGNCRYDSQVLYACIIS